MLNVRVIERYLSSVGQTSAAPRSRIGTPRRAELCPTLTGRLLLSIERLAIEAERLFGTAPGERDARAAVAVVVDARRALGYVLYF